MTDTKKPKSDVEPFKHGDEGTHTCCNKRLREEGGKARCCYCVPHNNCEIGESICEKCGESDQFLPHDCKVQPKSWEEEFARDFFNDDSWNVNHYHVVKDFIRNQIHQAKLEVYKDILSKLEAPGYDYLDVQFWLSETIMQMEK